MFKHIIDKDIELRMLEIIHAESMYELIESNRDHLRQWLPWLDITKNVDDSKKFIELCKHQYTANNGFQAGIWYKGELAGVIGFHKICWSSRNTSIGYWLGKDYRGKGLMIKACEAFINYALNDLNLNRVEIRCAEKNFKSRAIPERLGFIQEGTIREAEWLYDQYVSHIVYGILKSEWKK